MSKVPAYPARRNRHPNPPVPLHLAMQALPVTSDHTKAHCLIDLLPCRNTILKFAQRGMQDCRRCSRPHPARSCTGLQSALLGQAFTAHARPKVRIRYELIQQLCQGYHPVVSQSRTSSPFMVISAGGAWMCVNASATVCSHSSLSSLQGA